MIKRWDRKGDRDETEGVRYRDEILANRGLTLFQQDNARCHTAHVCTTYLQQQHVNVLPWPAKSPDLSAIEHL